MRYKLLLWLLLLVIAIGCGYWLVRGRGFSAREKPSAVEAFFAQYVRRLATPGGAQDIRNPIAVSDLTIAEARDHFADHCAVCHANDGSGRTAINEGLYPPAPDLRQTETQELSDGEIFYIIKNGIRFTGMPGWGGEDEENWKLVRFIRHLPNLTSKELELMHEINQLEIQNSGEHDRDHKKD